MNQCALLVILKIKNLLNSYCSKVEFLKNDNVKNFDIDNIDVIISELLKYKIPEKEIRLILRAHLPNYMIPTYIIQIDEMTYTINRKIDRKALPLPDTYKTIDTGKINIDDRGDRGSIYLDKIYLMEDYIRMMKEKNAPAKVIINVRFKDFEDYQKKYEELPVSLSNNLINSLFDTFGVSNVKLAKDNENNEK